VLMVELPLTELVRFSAGRLVRTPRTGQAVINAIALALSSTTPVRRS
jgi:hypothetical protein